MKGKDVISFNFERNNVFFNLGSLMRLKNIGFSVASPYSGLFFQPLNEHIYLRGGDALKMNMLLIRLERK